MAEEPENLVLEHLRAMRADIAAIREENRDMKARQAAVEDMFAFLVSAVTRMQHSIDRLAERTERIERRPGLIDERV
jgi:3-methyladenine DNA glycosylase/8-oxoguanine DNA glycosylase